MPSGIKTSHRTQCTGTKMTIELEFVIECAHCGSLILTDKLIPKQKVRDAITKCIDKRWESTPLDISSDDLLKELKL